jgi:radical SAM superfamily enzyme YgiQ (UPF0313 family)
MLKFYLPAAPAVLAGACRWLGKSYVFLDFNLQPTDVDRWSEQVIAYNPKIVALSVFTYKSRDLAQQLAQIIKSKRPDIKIVAGGSGIKDAINGDVLINADVVIQDDGEYAWAKLLDSSVDQFNNLSAPYFSDYRMYDLQPVTGSRGCVRRCTFCEIHQHWKFNQRTPDLILSEIANILQLVPTAHIHFTDSLVNGSLPVFENIVGGLALLKEQYPDFTWGGQFIIRNYKQTDRGYWQRIAESGGSLLEIGVETGSDTLRDAMGKHFTNEDLDYSLNYMSEFGIKCVLLLFVGYPTETLDDFNQTLELLAKYQSLAGNTISAVQGGYNMHIQPGSPVYQQSQTNKAMVLSNYSSIWYNKDNPTLTYEERARRRIELSLTAERLGYTMSYDNHIALEELKENQKNLATVIKLVQK